MSPGIIQYNRENPNRHKLILGHSLIIVNTEKEEKNRMNNIYANIVQRCKDRKTSIAAVEKAAGIGNGTISGWETGYPRIDTLSKVAAALDTTIEQLMSEPVTQEA